MEYRSKCFQLSSVRGCHSGALACLMLITSWIPGVELEGQSNDLLTTAAGARIVSLTSAAATTGSGSAEALIDGSSGVGWTSEESGQVPQSFVFELDQTYRIDRLALDNRGAETGAEGSSARSFTVTASVTSASEGFQIVIFADGGQGERSEFAAQYASEARWIKLDIYSNWGHAQLTRAMELELYGSPSSGSEPSGGAASGAEETAAEEGCDPTISDCEPPEVEDDSEPGSDVYWQGTITLRVEDPGQPGACSWHGSVQTDLSFNVRWKEIQEVDVRNQKGELTGQFVVLADDGSSWQGSRQGSQQRSCESSHETKTYSGTGTGPSTLRIGWIYYSYSEDDPLAAVLENGAYSLLGNEGEHFREDIHYVSVTPSGSSEHHSEGWTVASYRISRPGFLPVVQGTPFGTTADPDAFTFSDDLIAEAIVDQVSGLNVRGQDPQIRVIENGLMSGSFDGFGFVEPTIKTDISWSIRRMAEVSATVDHPNKDWLPTAGPESEPVRIKARIDQPAAEEGKFRFTLYDVTHEPGHAMNFGDESEDDADLSFSDHQQGFSELKTTADGDGVYVETLETVSDVEVSITPADYGGWGRLKCEVIVDGQSYECKTADGKALTIPLDHDENRIADAWQEEHGMSGKDADYDDEEEPKDQNGGGDGLSLYEEYRGFIVESFEHRRLDPKKKQLFIRDEDALVPGSGFEALTGLELIYINDDGWTGEDQDWVWSDEEFVGLDQRFTSVDSKKRRINSKTSGFAHRVDQHALHITAEEWQQTDDLLVREQWEIWTGFDDSVDTTMGKVFGTISSPGTISRVVVFVDHLLATVWEDMRSENERYKKLFPGSALFGHMCPNFMPYDEQLIDQVAWQKIGWTLAHEMGHGVGVHHHAPKKYGGDVACVMRYFFLDEKLRAVCPGYAPHIPLPWPTSITKNADCLDYPGNGVTSCWGQIRVSDEAQ